MKLPQPLPEQLVELLALHFRALSEPTRVRILDRLRSGERSASELVDELAASHQSVSKHLNILHAAGIVGRRREGNRVHYWIADDAVLELWEQVYRRVARQAGELRGIVEERRPGSEPQL